MLLKTTSPFPVPFFSVALRTLKMTHLAPVPSGQSMSERTLGTIQPCFLGRGQSGGTGSPHRDGARASRRVWAAEQGGHRDRKEGGTGGCGRGAARGLSAEMLTALSRPMAATLLFPVISGTVLPPTPTTAGPAGAALDSAHGPRGCTCHTHSQTRTHGPPHARTPAQAGAHDGVHAHTHVHSHTQTLTLRGHPPVSLL